MLQAINDAIQYTGWAPWIAIASSLTTLLIGYRLGINSERRKEYNELADPLYTKLNRRLSAASAHTFAIDEQTRDAVRRRMGIIQRRKFDAALREFDTATAKTTQDDCGQVHYTDVDAVNASLLKLAKVLKRK